MVLHPLLFARVVRYCPCCHRTCAVFMFAGRLDCNAQSFARENEYTKLFCLVSLPAFLRFFSRPNHFLLLLSVTAL